MHDQRRVGHHYVHPLRPVLEVPASLLIGLVVAPDEIAQGDVADRFESVSRTSAPDPPVAAPVEREPTVDRGNLSLIHISEPTRLLSISYAVFCLKKKK